MLLEWPEHSKKLIEGVNSLHTNFAAFHDVTLSAEGKQIKAHRVILAAASTYFKVSKLTISNIIFIHAFRNFLLTNNIFPNLIVS
jgi:acyl-CoA hydrolase